MGAVRSARSQSVRHAGRSAASDAVPQPAVVSVSEPSDRARPDTPGPGADTETGTPTILVVDDEVGILETYKDYLAPAPSSGAVQSARRRAAASGEKAVASYRLLTAETGERAVELVQAEHAAGRRIQAGFFDMKMPGGIDGLETIRRVRDIDPDVLCVIATAYQDRSLDDIASVFGPSGTDTWDYLNKPFTANEIVQKARNLTSSWQRRRRDEARSRQKDDLNRELEDAVAARTSELANANADLERKHEEVRRALQDIEVANERLRDEMAERERIETELRLAQKLEAVGQLAAGIAHEINTPIQYIGDNTEFLRTAFDGYRDLIGRLDAVTEAARRVAVTAELIEAVDTARLDADVEFLAEEVPTAINQTLEGVAQVSRIVSAMKAFSHPGMEQKSAVDINSAVETSATVSRNEWKYVSDLIFDLDPSLPPVMALGAELNQVFLNLIVNAAHAIEAKESGSGAKGVIRISSCVRGDRVEIRVQDTGTGIPADVVERIFTPFFTTKEVGKGTGQGLAIAHSVVERHSGRLTVETELGVGSTFIVSLPIEDPDAD